MASHKNNREDLKDLGRKARERREKEVSKRKEIVLLNEQPAEDTTPGAKKKSISIRPTTSKRAKKPDSSNAQEAKRRRTIAKRRQNSTLQQRQHQQQQQHDKHVDTRIPDVSHLVQEYEAHAGSNTVRIHGLPIDAQPSDLLLRFFVGLDPVCVFVLPSNRAHILGWDAHDISGGSALRSEGSCLLDRHPSFVRVYVKFSNAPAASLAAKRSGEVLYIGTKNNSSTSSRFGATIAVTQIPKWTAKYLQRNMAMECHNTNEPIQKCLQKCEDALHDDLVAKIVWTAAMKDLDLCASPETQSIWKQDLQYTPLSWTLHNNQKLISDHPSTSSCQKGYDQLLVTIHNQLMADYDILVHQVPFSPLVATVAASSPSKNLASQEPSIFLTQSATKHLWRKARQLKDHLYMARTLQNPSRPQNVFARWIEKKTA